jgi:poly(beta-D-mannuronate) lyase
MLTFIEIPMSNWSGPKNGLNFPRVSLISAALFSLVACGGSTTNHSEPTDTSVEQPDPTPDNDVCVNEIYTLQSALDGGNADPNYPASNAIDGNTASLSRWSSEGTNSTLTLDLGTTQSLGAVTLKWFKGDQRVAYFYVETSTDNSHWQSVLENGESSGRHSGFELVTLTPSNARYVRITGLGNNEDTQIAIIEAQLHSCQVATGEYTDTYPNELGIELVDWYLSLPTDEDNSGTADSIDENQLAAGYTNSEYFYASADQGIVMRAPSDGYKTSTNTSYVRVELREMLRRGDTSIRTQGVNDNNWVFGSASSDTQANAGGVDGDLHVTLAVNQVTTTGEDYQIGRLVIGQIHANDDEPIRLYYRKLPDNSLGSIYFAHESRVKDSEGDNIETYVEMIGSRGNTAANPSDGIALNEKFSYHISVNINLLTVTISREGKADLVANYDMTDSLYNEEDQYHYFKVGVYHLNNSSDSGEYAQATFYAIRNSHTGYSESE